jgi:hypothetical protein
MSNYHQVSHKLEAALKSIADKLEGGVKVGFLEGAKYPDGTPVAAVAFWNEFGTSTIPPRPFFRNMIAKESKTWADKMARLAKGTNNDGEAVYGMMGDDIAGALAQSIIQTNSPRLSKNTHKKSARSGFDKPLIDTGLMMDSIQFKVLK